LRQQERPRVATAAGLDARASATVGETSARACDGDAPAAEQPVRIVRAPQRTLKTQTRLGLNCIGCGSAL